MEPSGSSSPSHPFRSVLAGGMLLTEGPRVICIGIREFAEALWAQQVPCVHVDWSPSEEIGESDHISRLLDHLL